MQRIVISRTGLKVCTKERVDGNAEHIEGHFR